MKYRNRPGDGADSPPARRSCGTMPMHMAQLDADPDYLVRLAALEERTQLRLMTPDAAARAAPLTIPVVVHVVFRTAAQNISDAEIQSQIQVLNDDFGATNADRVNVPAVWSGLVVDSRIRFQLATTDPTGAPTNGITRTSTTEPTFFMEDESIKFTAEGGQDAWPTDRYLNFWVGQIDQRGSSDQLLGYAQLPEEAPATDGVVIWYRAFGTGPTAQPPFNLGRTATHEVGHWLNLYHIWGGGMPTCSDSDLVADTPNQLTYNQQKPTFPKISCNNGPNGDMFMNYMDYVDDDSMFMFTAQQVARMQAALDGPRSGLGT